MVLNNFYTKESSLKCVFARVFDWRFFALCWILSAVVTWERFGIGSGGSVLLLHGRHHVLPRVWARHHGTVSQGPHSPVSGQQNKQPGSSFQPRDNVPLHTAWWFPRKWAGIKGKTWQRNSGYEREVQSGSNPWPLGHILPGLHSMEFFLHIICLDCSLQTKGWMLFP